jgi:hypothetical protein
MILRQIEPPAPEGMVEQDRQADEQQGQRQQRATTEC